MLQMLRQIQVALVAGLVSFLVAEHAFAQGPDNPLAETVISLFSQATQFNTETKPRYALSRHFLRLKEPIVIPNLFNDDAAFRKALQSLESVMDLSVGVIHPLLDEHLPQAVSV